MPEPILTQDVLDRLPADVLARARTEFDTVVDGWRRGVQQTEAPWAQVLYIVAEQVRERGDELQREGGWRPWEREEYVTNSAVLRGLMLGWCVRQAAAESVLTGIVGGVVLDAVQAATVRDALENSRRVCAQSLSEREGEAVTCPCVIAADCLKLAALRAVGVEPEVRHAR
jgi:hypothetical protein